MERAAQREGCVAGRETEKHAGLHGSDRGSGEGSERGAQAKGEPRGHPGRRGCNNVPPPKSKMKKLGREKSQAPSSSPWSPPAVGTSPGPGTPGLRAGPSRACPLAAPALLWGAPPGGRDPEERDMERELCWRRRGATALARAGSNAAPPPESEEGVPV